MVAQGGKVAVFSQWKRMLRLADWAVRDVLGDPGLQAVFLTALHLVAEEGIESRIAGLVADKRAHFTSLFDGTSDEVVVDRSASFMATARALIDPAAPTLTTSEAASELDETRRRHARSG